MVFTEFSDLTEQMQILRLHCTFSFKKGGELPAFKGSTLHGWLGRQLLKQDPELYHLLYTEHDQQQPKPYALACHDYRTAFPKQSTLSFTLTLFGSVTQLADRVVKAMSVDPLGFGEQRLGISLHSIASETPWGFRLGIHILPMSIWLKQQPTDVLHSCSLQLLSPLRLKENGKIIKYHTPLLKNLLVHIQRRLSLLVLYWVDANPWWQEELRRPVLLGDHQLLSSAIYYEDWLRYSGSRQQLLPFGGLLGELSFQGDIYHALEWLQVGELLQIGGKTTFGLGCYRLLS
ncbi:MAG: CRISPR system precrRNA processing endoribonuclease RAMP protein Cas6 [Alcaligenaceae bacterium]|nr:CRISPR system precrRNA processing endoribonuclease RAMP protein Cas6 [Alcaligenaceae bacterium]